MVVGGGGGGWASTLLQQVLETFRVVLDSVYKMGRTEYEEMR